MSKLLRFGDSRRTWAFGLLAIAAIAVAACGPTAAQVSSPATNVPVAATNAPAVPTQVVPTQPAASASVQVDDQAIANGTVTIRDVVSVGPGWIVIHIQKDGAPGTVIGYAAVKDGENKDVVVQVDASKATATLYAMLHIDAGVVGTYEFPGADVPVKGDASKVNPTFAITGGLPAAPQTVDVTISNFSFNPAEVTVKAGTTIVWTNQDNVGHTVTSDTGLFDSGILNNGGTFSFTFTQAGTYPYYCRPHGGAGGVGMSGKVIVTP